MRAMDAYMVLEARPRKGSRGYQAYNGAATQSTRERMWLILDHITLTSLAQIVL